MAIQKRFIHFKKFSDFNSKKLSANEANTQYTVGVSGEVQNGEPDVLYQSYCWIKDTQQQWTHGQLYYGSMVDLSQYLTADEIEELYATYEDLNNKQDVLVSGTNIKTINGETLLGSGDITIEGGSGEENVQSDWNVTDTSSDAYIKNKPSIGNITAIDTSETLEDVDTATYIKYVAQTLTDAQKSQARTNINANETLISGTNIKTINGTSLLGSGNIVISGGGGDSGGSSAYSEVSHGTSDTTFTLTPNTFHVWDEVTSLTLTLGDETAGVANEFLFQFNSGSTATTLTLPDTIKWANDDAPTITENMIYQVSVLKGLASVLEFKASVQLIENMATMIDSRMGTVQFSHPVASVVTVTIRGDMTEQLTFNVGEQTKSASTAYIGGYTFVSISPSSDGVYNYVF